VQHPVLLSAPRGVPWLSLQAWNLSKIHAATPTGGPASAKPARYLRQNLLATHGGSGCDHVRGFGERVVVVDREDLHYFLFVFHGSCLAVSLDGHDGAVGPRGRSSCPPYRAKRARCFGRVGRDCVTFDGGAPIVRIVGGEQELAALGGRAKGTTVPFLATWRTSAIWWHGAPSGDGGLWLRSTARARLGRRVGVRGTGGW
jgi:hypothetical protein